MWRRAEIRRLRPALRGGRVFIAEEPGINHPENPGEKDGRRQKQWPWAINNAYTETKNRQEHRQAEEDHLCPKANALLALGRLAASKRVQSAGRNAVAREQVGHAVQTKSAARTKPHAIGSRLVTTPWTIHLLVSPIGLANTAYPQAAVSQKPCGHYNSM